MKSRQIVARNLKDRFFFHNDYDYFWKYSKGEGYLAQEGTNWTWTPTPMVAIDQLKDQLGWKEGKEPLVESLRAFMIKHVLKKKMEADMHRTVEENPLLA